jgi:hypothetical protein
MSVYPCPLEYDIEADLAEGEEINHKMMSQSAAAPELLNDIVCDCQDSCAKNFLHYDVVIFEDLATVDKVTKKQEHIIDGRRVNLSSTPPVQLIQKMTEQEISLMANRCIPTRHHLYNRSRR